ncbi:unnamed protein product [Lathyrus sativus]|nr:unnamed protein product [Lathyrus sativus]
MAAVIVGETLVSASMEALLQKLISTDFPDTEVDLSLLIKLKKTLARVQPLLHYYFQDTKWLDSLIDLAYQVDTLFHQINTKEAPDQTLTLATKVRNMFSSPFKHFHEVIHSKILDLTERLKPLILRGERDGLEFSNRTHVWDGAPTNSVLEHDSSIYGRDADIQKLKHLLLSTDSDGDSKIRVISIVGMGGIGKTFLAKHLYNDPQVKDKFELKVWAYISKDFDAVRVFETILKSITSQSISNGNLSSQILKSHIAKGEYTIYQNLLLVSLQQISNTSKFLLVLDDVWDTNSINWISLMDTFNAGEMGSKIIITTRDETVARSMQMILSVHYLRPLQNEDLWYLLVRYAFGPCNDQHVSYLEEIGRKIAKKCDGLPLAAVALGAVLYGKLFSNDWNSVLKSNIWESTIPELWIAEDLVGSFTGQERWKVGEEYFDVLVSKSLIQRRSTENKEENFEMHNLVHDLATMASSPYCIRLGEHYLHVMVQNLSYNRGLYDSFDKFNKLYGLKYLRTFLALPLQKQSPRCLLSNQVIHDLLPTMKQLRLLSLSNYKNITEVPKSIGDLLYLQYLNLSHTNIERLPSETCNLYNLQFLLLGGCKRLTELPEDMGKLVNLHHLDVSDTSLKKMPVQIAKLENLHTLSDFVVSKHNDGLKVADLGKFPNLHGKLSISQLQNVNDPFEVDQANTKMKEHIKELALEWDYGSTFPDSQIKSAVLEHLQPSTNLESLTIKGCGGISFPNWLGDFSFRNMVYLKISNCHDCLWLPPLGQLENLKELFIEGMPLVQTIGTEFYGSDSSSFQPFPSLEILHFEEMQEWDEWNLTGGTFIKFPSLKTLSLRKCPKLIVGNIVDKFPSLTELELRECPLLVQSMHLSDHVFQQLIFPLSSLQQLTIDGIPSSMSFPEDGLPKTLKFLIINNCENLEFLAHEYLSNYTSLEELKISYSCNSMTSFTLGALPVLKRLFIEGCKNLKSILIVEDVSLKSLSFLRSIKIWDCTELESFPPGGLATPNLVYFAIWKCEKLPLLPEAMYNLTNLQEMEIDNLPNLQSFVIDDLPYALRELTVGSVGGIMWNVEPTWEHLTCLLVLRINGGDGTVNTLIRSLLPASLVTLCIHGLNDTSNHGKWLQHLNSLQNLEIVNAPKLKSLPKGLPSSLSVLSITRCPLLVATLRRKRGKEWRKIAHIPSIIIDDELIT